MNKDNYILILLVVGVCPSNVAHYVLVALAHS